MVGNAGVITLNETQREEAPERIHPQSTSAFNSNKYIYICPLRLCLILSMWPFNDRVHWDWNYCVPTKSLYVTKTRKRSPETKSEQSPTEKKGSRQNRVYPVNIPTGQGTPSPHNLRRNCPERRKLEYGFESPSPPLRGIGLPRHLPPRENHQADHSSSPTGPRYFYDRYSACHPKQWIFVYLHIKWKWWALEDSFLTVSTSIVVVQ